MIRIMRMLCTGKNCVAKDYFHLKIFETGIKGIFLLLLLIILCVTVSRIPSVEAY